MKIGYVQTSPEFGNKRKNFEAVRQLVKGVSADLLVLPELFATGYAFTSPGEVRDLAEGPGETEETASFLLEVSRSTGAIVVGGFIERDADRYFNSSLIVYGSEVTGTYRKIHLFFREKQWFTPGDRPLEVHAVNGSRIGVMLCFDWIFPETARALALRGARVIAHPSNLVLPYCQSAMVTRCIENRVFAVTANRVGTEQRGADHFTFTGASQVTAPDGQILSSAPGNRPHVDVVEVDPAKADDKRVNEFNDVLKDRRPEMYR
jgi:predicted amidohydrolase